MEHPAEFRWLCEQGYDVVHPQDNPQREAESVISRLLPHPELWEALHLLMDGGMPVLEREGFTYAHFRDDWHFWPVNALLTLAWLTVDPDKAKEALARGIL